MLLNQLTTMWYLTFDLPSFFSVKIGLAGIIELWDEKALAFKAFFLMFSFFLSRFLEKMESHQIQLPPFCHLGVVLLTPKLMVVLHLPPKRRVIKSHMLPLSPLLVVIIINTQVSSQNVFFVLKMCIHGNL